MDHSQSTTQSLQLLLILIFRVNFLARWHTLPPFQIIIIFIFSRCINFATHLIFRFVAKSIHLDEKIEKTNNFNGRSKYRDVHRNGEFGETMRGDHY